MQERLFYMTSSARFRNVIISLLSKPLLDRLPESVRTSPYSLLNALPGYCKPFRFVELPPELRMCVYEYTDLPSGFSIYKQETRRSHREPSLARVCRSIRQEVVPAIYSKVKVWITNDSTDCLNLIPCDAINVITHICVDLEGNEDRISLVLKVSPGTALSYRLETWTGARVPNFQELDPTTAFFTSLTSYATKNGLNNASNDYRGRDLLALVKALPTLYDSDWLVEFDDDWWRGMSTLI